MTRAPLRVGIVGCGRMGIKRAAALAAGDTLVGCLDIDAPTAEALAREHRASVCGTLDELFGLGLDVVIVAVTHDELAGIAESALEAGAHVLVEKPAGLGTEQIDRLAAVEARTGRRVKVGFNHRFHPGIARAAAEVHSGRHGELLHVRIRYGHGGRRGYDREWRAQPERSGGGELTDQGMHAIDLIHWVAGPLPLFSALLRTHFWETPVEDNAALILGHAGSREGPWAMLHVTWTEWKNMFSMEIYCRTAKLQVDGLVHSYGPQRLRIYRMRPELGPPDVEELAYPDVDHSWEAEWAHFADAIVGADGRPLLGDLGDARYAWEQVEAAYAMSPYANMRAAIAR
jgi:predicted dehydrogenase